MLTLLRKSFTQKAENQQRWSLQPQLKVDWTYQRCCFINCYAFQYIIRLLCIRRHRQYSFRDKFFVHVSHVIGRYSVVMVPGCRSSFFVRVSHVTGRYRVVMVPGCRSSFFVHVSPVIDRYRVVMVPGCRSSFFVHVSPVIDRYKVMKITRPKIVVFGLSPGARVEQSRRTKRL